MIAWLIAFAFALALQAQTMGSPFAAAWLFPLLLACAMSVYTRGADYHRGALWRIAMVWTLALFFHTFFLRPIGGAASTLWILVTPSILLLTIQPRDIMRTVRLVGVVLAVYALGLIAQEVLDVRYTTAWESHSGRSWPVLDSNNAAALLNFGLIATVAAAMVRPIWCIPALIFAASLSLTNSTAGYGAAALAIAVVGITHLGKRFALFFSGLLSFCYIALHYTHPEAISRAIDSMLDRLPIWEACAPLFTWLGLGLGSFGFYYEQVRTETSTAGFYAHNDLIQLAVEGGGIIALLVIAFAYRVFRMTSKRNIVPAAMLLMVTLQAMMEFQFYVPAVAILTGLTLSWHRYAKIYHHRTARMMVFDKFPH